MKISIFSFAVNDKFPIDILYRQYKKYIKEDFEFILFNDAMDAQMEQNINIIAHNNKINCERVPQEIHNVQNPSEAYAETLNWAVQEYAIKNDNEIIALVHTDIFPIQDIKISNIIKNNIVASTMEYRSIKGEDIHYLYPAFTIINMKLVKDPNELDFGCARGLDTGGKTKDFVKNNKELVRFIDHYQISVIPDMSKYRFLSKYFYADLDICQRHNLSAGWIAEGFYHYVAGSQWNGGNPTYAQGHEKRMKLFLEFFY